MHVSKFKLPLDASQHLQQMVDPRSSNAVVHEDMVRVERGLAHMQPFQPTQSEFGENRNLSDHPLPDVHEYELYEWSKDVN